jgi:FAD/FMN-containing dehydrogenase
MDALIYGHAGNGNLHLRPLFDMTDPNLQERMKEITDGVYEIVFQYGGTVTAEHGMGRVRAPYLKREWGEKLYGYMKEIKAIFDPNGLFNPGVMFNNDPITEHFRISGSDR